MKRCSVFSFIFFVAWTSLSGEDDFPDIILRLDFPAFFVHVPGDSWSSILLIGSGSGSFGDNDDDDDDGWRTTSSLTTMLELELAILLLDARKTQDSREEVILTYTRITPECYQSVGPLSKERNRN